MFSEEVPKIDSTDVEKYKSIAIPLIRRTFPDLIAQQLVGVQPMTAAASSAYSLRFRISLTFKELVEIIKPVLESYGKTAPSFEEHLLMLRMGEEKDKVEPWIIGNHWLSLWFKKEVILFDKETFYRENVEQLVKDFILKERKEKLGKLLGE